MTERVAWRAGPAEPSLARLLDEVRQLIVEAWDRGEDPVELVVDPATHRMLDSAKRRELDRGTPLSVLGLRVERTPE